MVYGHAIKAVIHEKFNGDGIMSLIDCKVTVDKKPDPKGDRVVLTFEYVYRPRGTESINKFINLFQWEIPQLFQMVITCKLQALPKHLCIVRIAGSFQCNKIKEYFLFFVEELDVPSLVMSPPAQPLR